MTPDELTNRLSADLQAELDKGQKELEHRLTTVLGAYVTDLYDYGFCPFKLNAKMVLSHTENDQGHPIIEIVMVPLDAQSKEWIAKYTRDLTV